MKTLGLTLSVALATGGLAMVDAAAQTYPTQPVRFVVPFAVGGTVDTVARLIGQKLSESFNQPVVVENRPGAGGNIAAALVAKSAPDGHTILITTSGHAISPSLYRNLPYDPVADFVPVTQLNASTLLLVGSPKLPAKTLPEMIAVAKSKPSRLTYGMTGIGNPLHLTMEMFKLRAGIDLVAVPYRGDAPLLTALISGEVDTAVTPLPTTQAHIEAGKLRPLGIARTTRNPVLPDVPTIAEQGFPGFDMASWHGLFVPAKTPREIVMRIATEARKALESEDVKKRLTSLGIDPVGSTPDEFAALVKRDIEQFAEVIKKAGIPPQD